MKKYNVSLPIIAWVTVTDIEADNEEEAIDIALDEGGVTGYCGNGGSDKLIGVYGENIFIEASDEFIDTELEIKLKPYVEICEDE